MVLLVVDTQDLIVNERLYAFESFVRNVTELIDTARRRNTEVIYVRHKDGAEMAPGVDGFEIYSAFAPRGNEKIFDKSVNSAFKNTGLAEYLAQKQETQIMLVGLQTDYCIDATVKCGFEHGFQMLVPALCNTTVNNEFMTGGQSYRYYNQKMWDKRYARCVSMEEALTML